MKSALIIGSEGQDGRLLSELLNSKGYDVFGVDRSERTSNESLTYTQLDLENPRSVSNCLIKEFDEIYYLAAYHHSSGDVALTKADLIEKSFLVNTTSYAMLLQGLADHNYRSRVFYASSSLVFGGSGTRRQNESTPMAPNCIYSITKKAAMDLSEFYRKEYGLFISVGVLYNHESPYRSDAFLSKIIVNQMRDVVKGSRKRIILANMDAETDWGYAPDYVSAFWHLLQQDKGENYIVSSGKLRKVRDWLEVLCDYLNLDMEDCVEQDENLDIRKKPSLEGDNTKLLATGWKPGTSFRDMVIKIYDG